MSGRSERAGLVIIPAYNEEQNIKDLVARLRADAPAFDVVVVDDGSNDDTAALALAAGATVVPHPFNMGYGVALKTGYKYALRYGYPLVVQIDGDGQHDPGDVARLAEPIRAGRADVVYGSRFHPGSTYSMPFLKRVGGAWFATLVRWTTGLRVSDPTTGLQAISARVLQLYVTQIFPSDYPDADMIVFLHRNGFVIEEIAVDMQERPESRPMHSGIGVLYYVYKMSLAILMNVLRRKERSLMEGAGDDAI